MCEKPALRTAFLINAAFFLVHVLFILFVNCIHATTNWLLLGLFGHLEDWKLVDLVKVTSVVNKTSLLVLIKFVCHVLCLYL